METYDIAKIIFSLALRDPADSLMPFSCTQEQNQLKSRYSNVKQI
ncbi:hypothetical protein VCHA37P191_290010 [Vibrio chagasii]|nr:hypothetical protein VCHA37P191_290010 [Vibrio chagasii]